MKGLKRFNKADRAYIKEITWERRSTIKSQKVEIKRLAQLNTILHEEMEALQREYTKLLIKKEGHNKRVVESMKVGRTRFLVDPQVKEVPLEPTRAMLDARMDNGKDSGVAALTVIEVVLGCGTEESLAAIWKAMWKAA